MATTLKNAVISILLRTHNHCLMMDGKAVVQLRKLHDTAGYLQLSNTELLTMFPSCCHSVHSHLPPGAEVGSEVYTEMGRGGVCKLVWAKRANLATWHTEATRSTTHEDSALQPCLFVLLVCLPGLQTLHQSKFGPRSRPLCLVIKSQTGLYVAVS